MLRLSIIVLLSASACADAAETDAGLVRDAGLSDASINADSDAPTADVDASTHDGGGVADTGHMDGMIADVAGDDVAGDDVGPVLPRTPPSVIVFSRTEGFRHRSIADGIAMLREVATDLDWSLQATEDSTVFTPANLAEVDVVVFLNTSGDVLNGAQEDALRAWVMGGGGWVGVHAAADTEYDWPWYEELVGAWFQRHPATQGATLRVEERIHPAVRHLSSEWMRRDEWYDYRTNPRSTAQVLITIDESSYVGGEDGSDHPITWTKELGLGRSFYTGLGHTAESYDEPAFRTLLTEAILWAAGPED